MAYLSIKVRGRTRRYPRPMSGVAKAVSYIVAVLVVLFVIS
jgi:hypothetical protein